MGNRLQKPFSKSENDEFPEPQDHQTSFTCEICIEPMLLPDKKFRNRRLCSHPFCVDCMIKYIQVKLEENVAEIPCPALNCRQLLDPISCRSIIAPQVFVKWCDVLCQSSLLGLPRCYCPNRSCSALILNECCGSVKRSTCPNCKMVFCYRCKNPWHAGFRCEESRESRDRNDVAFGVLAEQSKWSRCPRCRHFVELIDGCKIVKCRCHASFCYRCGKQVNQHWCSCDSTSRLCMLFFRIFVSMFVIFATFFILRDLYQRRYQA